MIIPDELVQVSTRYIHDRWTVGVENTPWRYEAQDVYVEAEATRPLCVDAGRQIYLSLEKTRELGQMAHLALTSTDKGDNHE